MKRFKTHKVMIRVSFDAPLSAFEARHAVWNHLHGHVLYGDGKQGRGRHKSDHVREREPYGEGKVHANKANTPMQRPKKKAGPSVERDPNTIDMFERIEQHPIR